MSDNSTQKITINRSKLAACTIPEVYSSLQTSSSGLTPAEAEARLGVFGKNALREVKGTPLIYKFLANFVHLMALLLWAGGILAFVAQMPQLGVAVWAVILINAVFSFWQEFKAETARPKRLRNCCLHMPGSCGTASRSKSWRKIWSPGISCCWPRVTISRRMAASSRNSR